MNIAICMLQIDGETEALEAKHVTLRGFASKLESERQLRDMTTASNADH